MNTDGSWRKRVAPRPGPHTLLSLPGSQLDTHLLEVLTSTLETPAPTSLALALCTHLPTAPSLKRCHILIRWGRTASPSHLASQAQTCANSGGPGSFPGCRLFLGQKGPKSPVLFLPRTTLRPKEKEQGFHHISPVPCPGSPEQILTVGLRAEGSQFWLK